MERAMEGLDITSAQSHMHWVWQYAVQNQHAEQMLEMGVRLLQLLEKSVGGEVGLGVEESVASGATREAELPTTELPAEESDEVEVVEEPEEQDTEEGKWME